MNINTEMIINALTEAKIELNIPFSIEDTKCEAMAILENLAEYVGLGLVPSKLKHFGRIFDTFVFSSPDAANEFMSSEAGKNHGYLGKDESGYHCANNDDQGTTA